MLRPVTGEICDGCRRALAGVTKFHLRGPSGSSLRCGRCALTHRPLLLRSLGIAAIVGTVLLVINQGDVLLRGQWAAALAWKVPLTYLVPFVVATWGALVNSRVP
jgi:hypothetical protein